MNKKAGIIIIITLSIVTLLFVIFLAQKNKNEVEMLENSITSTLATEVITLTDQDQIKQALVAKNNWNEDEIEISTTENDGTYAKGMVGSVGGGPGGGLWFAEKVNGVWMIVWDGNGIATCEDLKAYPDFPTTLMPTCYNPSTGEMVER